MLILAFPLVAIAAKREWRKPLPLIAWYTVPATYLVLSHLHYAHSAGLTYQQSVLRKTWDAGSIGSDWAFQIAFSLKFWNWENDGWHSSREVAHFLGALTAVVFLAGWLAVMYVTRDRGEPSPPHSPARPLWKLLAAGFAMLAPELGVDSVLGVERCYDDVGGGGIALGMAWLAREFDADFPELRRERSIQDRLRLLR